MTSKLIRKAKDGPEHPADHRPEKSKPEGRYKLKHKAAIIETMIDDKGCSANQEPVFFPGAAAHISRVVCTGGFCPMVGGSVCGIAEKLRDSLAGDGFRKEVSLREFTTTLLQPVRLRLGLNAFGDYFQVKSPGKHDDDT